MESIQSGRTSTQPHKPLQRETERYRHRRKIEEAAAELEKARLARFSAADLVSNDQRRQLAAFHPMLEQRYFIETHETADFYDIVCDHAMARKSGLYVIGEYRVGKTTSMVKTMDSLHRDMPWIAILYHSATRKANQSKKSFCEDLLKSFRYPWSIFQDSEDLLARFMMTEAVQVGSRTCLLFVDEAQMLTVKHVRYLLEIWNELRQEDFILVTVLVGQEGLESLKTLTEDEDHGAVLARFFVKKYVLGGLHSLEDVRKYLGAYDTKLLFPGPEWPFARFFCMKAFDGGWRLESEAERFWHELVDHSSAADKMLAYTGFRLAFVNDSIHAFLLDSMKGDSKSFKGSKDAWKEAVSHAAESELFIGR
ncbi:ATP-binding protein [Rhodoferax sp.]|uniref:ATP-binding protein n=1 Tax=Rhodoferax sp. TaxID=50421 RepID=UPI002728101D|nr:ATP-binding protein [Rhodoferax sp.]MDO9196931.1 ATP-binding protein [Rhodoferax sp.]